MSKYKDMAKAKWQEKPGGSLRGHVSSLAGRVKPDNSAANNHVARPISELRDPSSFAPPPKRTGSGLAPAPAPTETGKRKTVPSPSKYQDPRTGQSLALYGSTDGIREEEHEHESEQQGQAAPRPYRVNTTGLSTDHLPPPPGRRDGTGGDAAAGAGGLQAIEAAPPPAYETAAAGRPSLPPRLPPRTNTGTAASSMAESPSADSSSRYLNQEAISRLGSAGVSVPGLGIRSQKQTTATATATATATPPPPPPRRPSNQPQGQVNELQNRLARYGISSSNATPQVQQEQQQQPQPAQEQEQGQLSGGTTWAQKQAALRTASSFNKDPSSVSVSDARTAAGTVNNFRQRHGHQVAAGAKSISNLNQKYGLSDKVGGLMGSKDHQQHQQQQHQQQQHQQQQQMQAPALSGMLSAAAGKKKPPPPPPKKASLGGISAGTSRTTSYASTPSADDQPPPVPMSTKPAF